MRKFAYDFIIKCEAVKLRCRNCDCIQRAIELRDNKAQVGLGMVWISRKLEQMARERRAPIESTAWQIAIDDDALVSLLVVGDRRCAMKQFQRHEVEACASNEQAQQSMEERLLRLVESFSGAD